MKKTYDLAVFIGRMQPLHHGHIRNINKALEVAEHVLVIVGSANQPRTPRNPFTVAERTEMVKTIFPTGRVAVAGVEDYYPDTRWLQNVQSTVQHHIVSTGIGYELGCTDGEPYCGAKLAILGHEKDHTSFYLNMFPKPYWEFVEIGGRVVAGENHIAIDATQIRERYLADGYGHLTEEMLPREIMSFLIRFRDTEAYKVLREEHEYIKRYKEAWAVAPYPVTFMTTDAVVVQSGYVLLVRRKTAPGKGLWALPGGFIGHKERLEDAAIRELREETKLKVPVPVLKGSLKARDIFDEPERSLRGRTITTAFLFDLADQPKLPKVKGGDDADDARWFPLDMIDQMSSVLFEDHKAIIHTMVAKLKD